MTRKIAKDAPTENLAATTENLCIATENRPAPTETPCIATETRPAMTDRLRQWVDPSIDALAVTADILLSTNDILHFS